jgi:hypothetical protein
MALDLRGVLFAAVVAVLPQGAAQAVPHPRGGGRRLVARVVVEQHRSDAHEVAQIAQNVHHPLDIIFSQFADLPGGDVP